MAEPTALVTGGASGIGLASVWALSRAGFQVAVNGLPGDPALDAVVADLSAAGARAVAAPFDVSDLSSHAAALDHVEHALGPVTCLVNNAGVGVMERGDPLDVTADSWDRCMSVNARGVFFLTQAVGRRMVGLTSDHPRSVIIVSSSNAEAVAVPRAEYCASKAAAAMVAKVFAARLAKDKVAVYDVRPGLIATDMTAPVIADYERRAADGLTLFPKVGQPEDVAGVIATLATGGLPYTTGHVINVDGGLLVPRF